MESGVLSISFSPLALNFLICKKGKGLISKITFDFHIIGYVSCVMVPLFVFLFVLKSGLIFRKEFAKRKKEIAIPLKLVFVLLFLKNIISPIAVT
jgi:hypothetical protein